MTDKQITTEQAQQLIEADRQQRITDAAQAIQGTLAQYQCDLIATPQIVDGRIVATVQIVAR